MHGKVAFNLIMNTISTYNHATFATNTFSWIIGLWILMKIMITRVMLMLLMLMLMYVVMRMKMIVMMMSDNRGLVQISDLDTTICRGGIVVEPNPNLSPHTLIIYPTSQKYNHYRFQIVLKIHCFSSLSVLAILKMATLWLFSHPCMREKVLFLKIP